METVIVPFRAEHTETVRALNRAWLDAYDIYEPADEAHLAHPMSTIVERGGAIFVALDGATVIGTAAVMPHGDGCVELMKVTVAEAARGRGLGRALVERCVGWARDGGARRMMLLSSTRLVPALRLYESMGFVRGPVPASVPFVTVDVYMERALL